MSKELWLDAYMEYCKWMDCRPNTRDQRLFMAGMIWSGMREAKHMTKQEPPKEEK